MVQKIGQITNGDIILNGADVGGRVDELDFGEIANKEIEHSALGMIAVLALPGRPVDAIKGKIKFGFVDEEVERDLISPTKFNKLQIHSYIDVFDANGLNVEKSHTLVTHLSFSVMKRGGLSAKLGDKMGSELDISIHSFIQKVYGDQTPIIEFDAFAGIYNVNGKPVWPT